MEGDWSIVADELQALLKLKSKPVGVKLCRSAEELQQGRVPTSGVAVCQAVKGAALAGWQLGCALDQVDCFTAQMILGVRPQSDKDTAHHARQFVESDTVAQRMADIKPKLGVREFAGLLVGPLGGFEPDVVLLIVDSLQAMGVIEARTRLTGEALQFTNGVSSAVCSYSIVGPIQTGRINLAVPCVGARRYAAFQDHELILSLPRAEVKPTLAEMKAMEQAGKWHVPVVNGYLSPTVPINYLVKPPQT
jgi:uncharacterized protein (DUF169 family)